MWFSLSQGILQQKPIVPRKVQCLRQQKLRSSFPFRCCHIGKRIDSCRIYSLLESDSCTISVPSQLQLSSIFCNELHWRLGSKPNQPFKIWCPRKGVGAGVLSLGDPSLWEGGRSFSHCIIDKFLSASWERSNLWINTIENITFLSYYVRGQLSFSR